MKFHVDFLIRFQHCDPAGIVFYPRYFEMINSVVEDWFDAELGASIRDLNRVRREGIPMAHIECDFVRPSLIGDVLTFELQVERIGRSSFSIAVSARHGAEQRIRVRQTLVYTELSERLRPIPIPDDIRARMRPFLVEGE